MPIWLRRFTHNKINEHYTKENESYESAKNGGKNKKSMVDSTGKVNTPEFMQASKQYKKSSSYK